MAKLYRKKPVEIFAEQYTKENESEVIKFLGGYSDSDKISDYSYETDNAIYFYDEEKDMTVIVIKTLEGNMTVSLNDYVICGVNGEFYPCKPDIFEKTYEPVEKYPAAESTFDISDKVNEEFDDDINFFEDIDEDRNDTLYIAVIITNFTELTATAYLDKQTAIEKAYLDLIEKADLLGLEHYQIEHRSIYKNNSIIDAYCINIDGCCLQSYVKEAFVYDVVDNDLLKPGTIVYAGTVTIEYVDKLKENPYITWCTVNKDKTKIYQSEDIDNCNSHLRGYLVRHLPDGYMCTFNQNIPRIDNKIYKIIELAVQ